MESFHIKMSASQLVVFFYFIIQRQINCPLFVGKIPICVEFHLSLGRYRKSTNEAMILQAKENIVQRGYLTVWTGIGKIDGCKTPFFNISQNKVPISKGIDDSGNLSAFPFFTIWDNLKSTTYLVQRCCWIIFDHIHLWTDNYSSTKISQSFTPLEGDEHVHHFPGLCNSL